MSSSQQKPIIPSVDYRWGLYKLSAAQTWIGLTERETLLIYELSAKHQPENWLIWQLGWSEWRSLVGFEPQWKTKLAQLPNDLPKPPKPKESK